MSPTDPAALAVKQLLKRTRSKLSEGDVAAGTGLDVASAKAALYALMRTHRCALTVHDDGTLVYDFGSEVTPLGRRTWRDGLASVAALLWRWFCVAYKASLAVVLVAYAVIFVVLILALAVAAASKSEERGPVKGALRLVGAIFRAIFELTTYQALTYDTFDRRGYRHAHFEPKTPVLPRRRPKAHAKGFVASVYDYVLGPARVAPHPRAQHREVAAFVRGNRGVLTVADVQKLSGMPRGEAEAFFANFVAEQDGNAEITDDGVLYATFEELLRSHSTAHDEPIVYYWDEYDAPYELTGNSAGKNVLVTALALFNLVCGTQVMQLDVLGPLRLWLGLVPTVIFALFFLVPLVRAPIVWRNNRAQRRANVRKRLFKAAFRAREPSLSAAIIVRLANELATTEERLHFGEADVHRLAEDTLADVGEGREVGESGDVLTDVRRLRVESQIAESHGLEPEARSVVYRTEEGA